MKDASGPGQFHAKECDITKEQNVIETLNWVKSTLGAVNILINNAGAIKHQKIEGITVDVCNEINKACLLLRFFLFFLQKHLLRISSISSTSIYWAFSTAQKRLSN